MGRDVPGWVYRRQIEALEQRARRTDPAGPASHQSKREPDPVRGPSQLRVSESAATRLLNIDWGELRRLVDTGRLETHRGEQVYDRWYLRSEIDAMVKASLRGVGPRARDRPLRTYKREGTPIGYGVTLDDSEVLVHAASIQTSAQGNLNALNAAGNLVAHFRAGRWGYAVRAMLNSDMQEPNGDASDGPR
jgi:hypothetical protein